MKDILFILKYTKKVKYLFLLLLLCVLIYSIGLLISPLIVSYVLDNVINGLAIHDPMTHLINQLLGGSHYVSNHLWVATLSIIVVFSVVALAVYLKGVICGVLSETFAKNIRDHVYDHLQKLDYSYHKSKESGDLIQRSTSDIDQIRRTLATQFAEMFFSIFTSVTAIIILVSINPTLTLLSFFVLPILFISSYIFFKRSKKIFLECDESESMLTSVVQENLAGVRVVKAFNAELEEIEKFERANDDYREKLYRLIHAMSIFWSVTDIFGLVQILIMLVAGIEFVQSGAIGGGQYFVFLSYVSFVIWPLRQLGRILADLGKLSVSIKRIDEILKVEPEDLDKGIHMSLKGQIDFKHVSFRYQDDSSHTLTNINLSVSPKQTIAVMGPTGSGKSSLVNLMSRLYEYEGNIQFDGVELRDIAKGCVRQQVGIVLQEPFLFSKTIYDNLALSAKEIAEEKVYDAARTASIHDVIQEFSLGYKTEVGEKGVTLSGGQKQRIAIARTLVNECPILIFDDSLSALDSKTDAAIQNALKNMKHKATMFIVTHRVNSAIQADKIIILEGGKIVQQGSHEQLVNEKGFYQDIYTLQMGEEVR